MNSGNTDGKGQKGVLEDLANAAPTGEGTPENYDWLLAGTMIVLSAEMKFLPIKNQEYYLYERGRLYIAMLPPWEAVGGRGEVLGEYIGSCKQRADCLWEVCLARAPSGGLPANARFLRGKWNNERFGYYNNILAFHVAKQVKLLPRSASRLLGTGKYWLGQGEIIDVEPEEK